MEFAGIIFLGKMAILLLFSNYLAKRPFKKNIYLGNFFFFLIWNSALSKQSFYFQTIWLMSNGEVIIYFVT